MSKLIYYLVLAPLSKLPLTLLYIGADFVYVLFRTVWPYRKTVIESNLKNSFPEKSASEIKTIRNRFYRHLADLLVEGIRNFGISKKELQSRISVENPQVMQQLLDKKRNILLVGGHYGNWEWVITSQALLFEQHAIGLGKPLTNSYFDTKINALRGRFGMDIVHAKNYKEFISKPYDHGFAMLTLSDQAPGDSLRSYWMNFLNQQTPVLYGAEQMAHEYDLSVVFFSLKKLKRGHYSMHLELICESPKGLTYGEITEKHTRLLEAQIMEKPEFWLWSHKRWKRTIPENLEQVMAQHKANFDIKYGKQTS
jgi:Kdo2-lipid IVA lauroyltransferase/acyltransferase